MCFLEVIPGGDPQRRRLNEGDCGDRSTVPDLG